MKVVLHDLEPSRFESLYPKLARDSFIVGEEGPVRNCVGCFGCWCKTPGKCVIPDGYGDFGKRLGACGEYLILSRVVYGGFSPLSRMCWTGTSGTFCPSLSYERERCLTSPAIPTGSGCGFSGMERKFPRKNRPSSGGWRRPTD